MRFSSALDLVGHVRRILRAVSRRSGIADVVGAFRRRIDRTDGAATVSSRPAGSSAADRAASSDGSAITPSRGSSAGGPVPFEDSFDGTASAQVGLDAEPEADVPTSEFDMSASAPPRADLRLFAGTTPGAHVNARSASTSSDTARQPAHQQGDARGVSPVLPEEADNGPARINDPGDARERARVAKLQLLQRTGAAQQIQANAAPRNILPLVGGE